MGSELTTTEKNMISLIDKNELGDLLKPLTTEIHLFDSYVAGTTHLEDATVLDSIKKGDDFSLIREKNKFDDNAILILNGEKKKVGYIPEKDNIIFARLLDAGKKLKAKVADVEIKGSFHRISIGIYLVDF